jgi:glycosyltransferase involved in cell wall biosynthesis
VRNDGALLCIANYSANVGYAWDFIEGLYAQLADHLATHGIVTYVAYPAIPEPPRSLAGSAAVAVELDTSLTGPSAVGGMVRFIRRHHVRLIYLTDRAPRSLVYPFVRAAGARVLIHDHASGARTRPRGVKWLAKWLIARIPGLTADVVVAVSDYVARRQIEVGLTPAHRVVRVWNGLPILPQAPSKARPQSLVELAGDRPVVACACRATPEKGVDVLLHAHARLLATWPHTHPRPMLLYIGSGPHFDNLVALRDQLGLAGDATLVGYRPDAAALIAGAQVCVVPSVWQDAFPLAVLEAMARAKPIVATAVGGIPEMIEPGVTGLLVPPADDVALAHAIQALLNDAPLAAQLGAAAQQRVLERFTKERHLASLAGLVEKTFGISCVLTKS